MTKQIFRPSYYPGGEENFKEALEERELEEARKILDKFPTGRDEYEDIDRIVAQLQGYKTLVIAYETIGKKQDLEVTLSEREKLEEIAGKIENSLSRYTHSELSEKEVNQNREKDLVERMDYLQERIKELAKYRGELVDDLINLDEKIASKTLRV